MMLFEITRGLFLNNKQHFQWQYRKYLQTPWGPPNATYLCSVFFLSSDALPSSNKKNLFCIRCQLFFKPNTHILNTYLCFSNTETCYLNHDTKHIFFCFINTKTYFSTTLFKPHFSHLFKQ